MKPVINPNLPWPAKLQTLQDALTYVSSLIKYLQGYLADLVPRVNGALQKDGTEAMTGPLDLGGQAILNGGAVSAGAVNATSVSTPAVAFPATQVPSANVNILDDYEEGTWTPVITGTGGTPTGTFSGRYTKIGNLVAFTATLTITATNSATAFKFTLPFPVVGFNGPFFGTVGGVAYVGVVTAGSAVVSVTRYEGISGASPATYNYSGTYTV